MDSYRICVWPIIYDSFLLTIDPIAQRRVHVPEHFTEVAHAALTLAKLAVKRSAALA